jgi:hypothetical protein
MNLPNQSQPILRSGNAAFALHGIQPSGWLACKICKAGCNLLPVGKAACLWACNHTVC